MQYCKGKRGGKEETFVSTHKDSRGLVFHRGNIRNFPVKVKKLPWKIMKNSGSGF